MFGNLFKRETVSVGKYKEATDRISHLEYLLVQRANQITATQRQVDNIKASAERALKAQQDQIVTMDEYIRKLEELCRAYQREGRQINKPGPAANEPQFTNDDIRRLIQLCHPDKHQGSKAAVEMTQRLNKLRG